MTADQLFPVNPATVIKHAKSRLTRHFESNACRRTRSRDCDREGVTGTSHATAGNCACQRCRDGSPRSRREVAAASPKLHRLTA
jgi:hypothetical protein